jgi:RNA polymerase sigma factor (sigma-70 family)
MNSEGSESFPIVANVSFKHGILVEALQKRGWNQSDAARFLDIDPVIFGRWINMQKVPRRMNDELMIKLYEFTGKSPEEIWPEDVFTPEFLALPKNVEILRKVPKHLLSTFGVLKCLPSTPEEDFTRQETREIVRKTIVESLKGNQKKVIIMRYFDGMTQKEIGKILGVCGARIDQIESTALSKMRHPRQKRLRSAAGF